MKQDLQKELKEKVKEGVKPSDLKRLKRSKSASDIPSPFSKGEGATLPLPPPELDAKYPYTQLVSQAQEIDELKKETKAKSDTIKLLRDKIEKLEANPPRPLLADQLKEKQREIEDLRAKLDETNLKLSQTTQELDNSLFARTEAVRQFDQLHEKLSDLKLQLIQETDTATDEIISQDQEISKLRGERQQFKLKVGELERDLEMVRRLAEMRKDNVFRKRYSDDNAPDWLRVLLWGVMGVSLVVWLIKPK